MHTAAGLDPPGRNETVRRALSGIRRIRATPQNRRAPLLLADIRTLMISIAESAGVKMPSFFGYMLYSGAILIPLFGLVTVLFFA